MQLAWCAYAKICNMNYFMQLVSKGWYRVYYIAMLAFSLLMLAAYGAVYAVPGLSGFKSDFPLTAVFFLAVTHALYSLTLYWPHRKRQEVLALLTGTFIFGMMALAGMDQGQSSVIRVYFAVAWFVATFFNGLYGIPLLLGTPFLVIIYVLTQVHFDVANIDWFWWSLLGGMSVVAIASYAFWRRHYIGPQQEEINRLSDMLHSNKQQSLILIQSIIDGVVVADTIGRITLLNPNALHMTPRQTSPSIGVDVRQVFPVRKDNGRPFDEAEDPFTIALRDKKHMSSTVKLPGVDGKDVVTSLVISPITMPDSGVFVGIIAILHDVSKEYAVEQERINFVNTASHEMRTPMATIEGYLSLVLNQKAASIPDTATRDYLEKSYKATQHLGKLFRDLLTTSQAEQGELVSSPQAVDLRQLLQEVINAFKGSGQEGSANITFNPPADVEGPYLVWADPDRLHEVVANLLDNAAKYAPGGTTTVTLEGSGSTLRFSVQDTGQGIAEADIPHLFQKFYRTDNSDTRVSGGTGLGLYICKKIVELYKGRIWVESAAGKGSTFYVELPRYAASK